MESKTRKLDFNGINFELPERYEPIKLIGKGTYGAVVSAIDHLTNEKVAIKKLAKIEDMVNILFVKYYNIYLD
jgi:serine/threonine protein kinase